MDNRCGGLWSAASNSKRKSNSVEETGIVLSTCRHRIGQKVLNMFQGELFGYPMYLLKNYNSLQYCFTDVMCKFWKFVTSHEHAIASTVTPALSVMHAKGHALDCQVQITF